VLIHTFFDFFAAISAMTVTAIAYRWRLRDAAQKIERAGLGYALALIAGAALGGFGFGTANLWLSGEAGIARSIVGALAGAIAAIEMFKKVRGLKGSTGLIFVPAFATSVTVGRWGCFLSGVDDHTYGTATTLPWGHDFGDGILRHPVQLYESAAMATFLIFAATALARRWPTFLRQGFYLMVLFYAAQRFLWEFLKSYATLIGPFNMFHFICLGLICYSVVMMGNSHERAASQD
jgi:phosphatidylglycerol---prolipoprotein diacylglyceryl transferase